MSNEEKRVFSGEGSRPFWDAVSRIKGKTHSTIYSFGCRAQESEARVSELEAEVARLTGEYERGARDFADWVRGQEFNVRAHLATVEIEIKPDAVDRFMARAALAGEEVPK